MTSRVPLLACIAVLSFFAGVTGVRLAYTLTYILIVLLAVAFCWARLVSRRLSVERDAPGGTFSVGQAFTERLTIHNGSVLPVPYCELRDQTRLEGYSAGRALSLGSGETRAWSASGTFVRRGNHRFGPLEARLGDPFGLFPQRVVVAPATEVLVHPAVHHLDALPPSGGITSEGRRGPLLDAPPDVSSIREHDPGDGLNRIHWASTARSGRLMSRTFDSREVGDLLVILDLRAGIHAGIAPESSLEYAVSVAASICEAAIRGGHAVGLAANDAAGTAIGAGRGEVQRLRLLRYLATAQDDGRQPLAPTIARHAGAWRGHGGIAVVTGSCEESWVEALLDASAGGQRHLCAFIDPTSFGAPGTPLRLTAAWRLVLDWWVIRRGDTIGRSRAARAVGL